MAGTKNTGKTTTRKSAGTSKKAAESSKDKKSKAQAKSKTGSRVRDEILSIIIMAVGVFFAIAVHTKTAGDVGIIVRNVILACFGGVGVILPYYMILYGILLMFKKTKHINGKSIFLISLIFIMISVMYSCRYIDAKAISFAYIDFPKWAITGIEMKSGGIFGMLFALLMMVAFDVTGLYLFASITILICMILIMNTPISQFIEDFKTKREIKRIIREEAAQAEEEENQQRTENLRSELSTRYEEKLKKGKALSIPDAIPHLINRAKAEENKSKIINLMQDENLFKEGENAENTSKEEPEIQISYGLEEMRVTKAGFGLEEEESVEFVNSNAKETQMLSLQTEEEKIEPVETVHEREIILPKNNQVHKIEGLPTESVREKQEIPLTKKQATEARLSASDFNTSAVEPKEYIFPDIELLNKGTVVKNSFETENLLKKRAEKLEQTLQDFKVDAKVVQVTQGPAVTRYEIHPNTGVKVSSIVRLADDIALNLEAKSIRIEAPIPGKAAVGIEVENEKISMVSAREIIDSKEFKESKSKLTFAVGKDIAGKAIVADLKSMPHLLIAGSTGSGKSVCINSIIISMLYKARPDEVKFVLVDPKVVELSNYNGIPHMLIPVVTEPGKAAAALNWAVAEMEDRYRKFAESGTRELSSYNDIQRNNGNAEGVLPQIVIIIDELADLMMSAPSQVEESICRLAQKARAAGMHMIVATQRPSVDVITGVIKANIPSRIAFAVSSQIDSRTILDMGGAEKLVGKGDMLFNPLGSGKPVRVQGNFISDDEVNSVIEYLKSQCQEASYANEVIDTIENGDFAAETADDGDELLSEAIETVVRAKQASVSMLQRRFRIGYNRAARIVEMMEARGIIGPADGSRPRQVLMSLDEFTKLTEPEQEAVQEEKTDLDEFDNAVSIDETVPEEI